MSVMPALRRLRQEDHKLEAHLGNIVRPCLKKRESERDHQWLMPIILATEEADIRRIAV
jgi:hypothetical protein